MIRLDLPDAGLLQYSNSNTATTAERKGAESSQRQVLRRLRYEYVKFKIRYHRRIHGEYIRAMRDHSKNRKSAG